jgi:hypothetical protein
MCYIIIRGLFRTFFRRHHIGISVEHVVGQENVPKQD